MIEQILETERDGNVEEDHEEQVPLKLKGSCSIEDIPNTSHDIDENPDEKQPHFPINLNRIKPPPLAKRIDKQNDRKGLGELLFL